MKEYWHYECEHNHGWVFMRDADAEESIEDTFCPWGHEAIILRKRTPTRSLQISLRSAEEIDSVGKVSLSNRYYLVLTDLNTNEERLSTRTFTPGEIGEVSRPFYALSVELGWQLLDKMEQRDSAG